MELTMPMLTEPSRPSGFPNAITSSPCRTASELPKRRCGKPGAIDFDHGDVDLAIHADQLRVQQLHFRLKRGGAAAAARHRKPDLNAPGAPHHVRVGDDVAVVGQNDAGAGAVLLRKQAGGVAGVRFVGRDVAGGKDLNHGRTDAIHQAFERDAEFAQRDGRRFDLGAGAASRIGLLVLSWSREAAKPASRMRSENASFLTSLFSRIAIEHATVDAIAGP